MSAEPAPAHRVVALLQDDAEPARLLDPGELAARLSVDRSWVYEHASELGALRLGDGPRARLRFDPVTVAERLTGERHTVSARTRARPVVDLLPINPPTHPAVRRTLT